MALTLQLGEKLRAVSIRIVVQVSVELADNVINASVEGTIEVDRSGKPEQTRFTNARAGILCLKFLHGDHEIVKFFNQLLIVETSVSETLIPAFLEGGEGNIRVAEHQIISSAAIICQLVRWQDIGP